MELGQAEAKVRSEFKSRKVTEEGGRKIDRVRELMSRTLDDLEEIGASAISGTKGGRELALARTHLETAGHFAVKAVAIAHEQPA
jgi:hypothetical protein